MGKYREWLGSIGILAALAAAGHGHPDRDGLPAASPSASPSAKAPAAVAAPGALSEAECRDYAEAVIKAVEAGDQAAFNGLVHWDALFETMLAGLDISEPFRSGVLTGLRSSLLNEQRGFAGQLVQTSKRGGSIHFLRTRQNHGRQVVLFRFLFADSASGVNYYEFVPRRSPDGRVRATDIYVYLSGEFLSETLRRTLLPILADRSRSIFDRLIAGERDYVQDFPRIGEASQLVAQGKPAEALAIYKTMRPATRNQKIVLLGRLAAAQAVDEKEYAAVIEDFRRLFPDDPCLDIISIDGYLLRKDYSGAMKALDRLDRSLGGDPYLDLLRANISEERGDRGEARRFARLAVEREPSLLAAHWTLVTMSLHAKDYQETLERLKEIDRRFTMKFKDMTKLPIYAGFVKSPQHAEWLTYLEQKKAARKPTTTKAPQKDAADVKRAEPKPPRSGGPAKP